MRYKGRLWRFLFSPPPVGALPTGRLAATRRFAERLARHPVDLVTHLGMVRSNAYYAAGCPLELCDHAAARDLWAVIYQDDIEKEGLWHPKDGDHRKRIFALAGDTSPREFTVRVASARTTSPESRSVKATLTAFNLGTPGTGKTESEKGVPGVPSSSEGELVLPPICAEERLPYLTADGTLSIPFDSPERYHYWKMDGIRLHVSEIMAEVKERMKNGINV